MLGPCTLPIGPIGVMRQAAHTGMVLLPLPTFVFFCRVLGQVGIELRPRTCFGIVSGSHTFFLSAESPEEVRAVQCGAVPMLTAVSPLCQCSGQLSHAVAMAGTTGRLPHPPCSLPTHIGPPTHSPTCPVPPHPPPLPLPGAHTRRPRIGCPHCGDTGTTASSTR